MSVLVWLCGFLFTQTAPPAPPDNTAPPSAVSPTPQFTAKAPSAQVISLADALKTAVAQNRGLREAGLRIRTAAASVRAAHAMFDTTLSADLTFAGQEAEFLPDQFFAVTSLKKYGLDLQASRLLPTGGMVGLKFSSSRTDQTMTIAMGGGAPMERESKTFANSFTFVFSHPLLAGFGKDVTTAQLQKARIQLDAERLAREAKAQALVRDVVTAYWNLWMAWQERAVVEMGLTVAQSQLELTRSLLTVGHAKPSDLLAVENALAQRQGDLLMMRARLLQASLQLKTLLGLPLDDELLRPADAELTYAPRSLPAALVAITLKRSRELAQLEKQLESLRRDELMARQGLLPKLNVTLTAGPSSTANEYSTSWENLVKFSAYTVTGGLSFSWSVERTAARAQLEIIENTRENLQLQKENIANALVSAALLARESMRTAEQRIQLARVAVEAAQAHLKLENDLFQLGRGTNHSVLLRMAELDSARLSQIKAVYDYQIAWVQILALSGDIFQEYGIQLP